MKCVAKCPLNPYVLSKAGRTCLETGRKIEAINFFSQVKQLYKGQTIQLKGTAPVKIDVKY
jgi:hypothetical protein